MKSRLRNKNTPRFHPLLGALGVFCCVGCDPSPPEPSAPLKSAHAERASAPAPRLLGADQPIPRSP
ncbi:MAG: hypothetical protein MK135_16290, partial [Polyangiaceae bacterium]|nr:hypothetical protein [Polyangiaceae bacterium]